MQYDAVEAFARGLMSALLNGAPSTRAQSEPPSRRRSKAKRNAPIRPREPARGATPEQMRLGESPVPEYDHTMPSPPFTQADYERMDATLRGEAPVGYYKPREGSGAGDGVS